MTYMLVTEKNTRHHCGPRKPDDTPNSVQLAVFLIKSDILNISQSLIFDCLIR